ncbi:hypothetical protein [Rhizobium leguminosarum]|nr:hypothetical protein [Rhizobium leguminosarum]
MTAPTAAPIATPNVMPIAASSNSIAYSYSYRHTQSHGRDPIQALWR